MNWFQTKIRRSVICQPFLHWISWQGGYLDPLTFSTGLLALAAVERNLMGPPSNMFPKPTPITFFPFVSGFSSAVIFIKTILCNTNQWETCKCKNCLTKIACIFHMVFSHSNHAPIWGSYIHLTACICRY